MVGINPQAEELNSTLKNDNAIVYNFLSKKGKILFFPAKGILSQAKDAKGKKINATIGAGIEDDGTPMRLQSVARAISLDPKDVFPYAPSYGKPALREKWLELIKEKNPSLTAKTTLPVVTNALTHGLSMLGFMFLDEGDSVILPDKFWGNYKAVFQTAYGVEFNTFNTFKDGGFDIESFKKTLAEAEGKKVILLNFPNNPTGYTPTVQEAEKIIQTIKEVAEAGSELMVICDDAYFGLIYENGVYKESLFSKLADIHENVLAVKIDGATKEDYVWGFRVGFITYAMKGMTDGTVKALEAKTAGAIRGNISNASHLSQSLVLQAFTSTEYQGEKEEKFLLLQLRYKAVKKALEEEKYKEYFEQLPNNSGYFMCVELKKHDGEKIRQILLEKYSTGVIAIGKMLRVAYSSVSKDLIPELFENIYNACKEEEK
jgi:aspartate/methionine/tyrosine aminotransferase